jgi:hypothetical protein
MRIITLEHTYEVVIPTHIVIISIRNICSRYSNCLRAEWQRGRVRVPVGARFFSSPRRPDQFWGPSSLISKGYRAHIPRE